MDVVWVSVDAVASYHFGRHVGRSICVFVALHRDLMQMQMKRRSSGNECMLQLGQSRSQSLRSP